MINLLFFFGLLCCLLRIDKVQGAQGDIAYFDGFSTLTKQHVPGTTFNPDKSSKFLFTDWSKSTDAKLIQVWANDNGEIWHNTGLLRKWEQIQVNGFGNPKLMEVTFNPLQILVAYSAGSIHHWKGSSWTHINPGVNLGAVTAWHTTWAAGTTTLRIVACYSTVIQYYHQNAWHSFPQAPADLQYPVAAIDAQYNSLSPYEVRFVIGLGTGDNGGAVLQYEGKLITAGKWTVMHPNGWGSSTGNAITALVVDWPGLFTDNSIRIAVQRNLGNVVSYTPAAGWKSEDTWFGSNYNPKEVVTKGFCAYWRPLTSSITGFDWVQLLYQPLPTSPATNDLFFGGYLVGQLSPLSVANTFDVERRFYYADYMTAKPPDFPLSLKCDLGNKSGKRFAVIAWDKAIEYSGTFVTNSVVNEKTLWNGFYSYADNNLFNVHFRTNDLLPKASIAEAA